MTFMLKSRFVNPKNQALNSKRNPIPFYNGNKHSQTISAIPIRNQLHSYILPNIPHPSRQLHSFKFLPIYHHQQIIIKISRNKNSKVADFEWISHYLKLSRASFWTPGSGSWTLSTYNSNCCFNAKSSSDYTAKTRIKSIKKVTKLLSIFNE
jgi:hypothetical protein